VVDLQYVCHPTSFQIDVADVSSVSGKSEKKN
jgi:hypothetical protein